MVKRQKINSIKKDRLIYLYNKKNMTQHEIADYLKIGIYFIQNRMKKYNIPRRIAAKRNQFGMKNHMWKGGKRIGKYITILNHNHPRVKNRIRKYVPEHILIMERNIKRKLKIYGFNNSKNEVVHHIDENPHNNKLKNLQLMTHGEHVALHNRLRDYSNKDRNTITGRFI